MLSRRPITGLYLTNPVYFHPGIQNVGQTRGQVGAVPGVSRDGRSWWMGGQASTMHRRSGLVRGSGNLGSLRPFVVRGEEKIPSRVIPPAIRCAGVNRGDVDPDLPDRSPDRASGQDNPAIS